MNDNIEIGVNAGDPGPIDRLTTSIDKLFAAVEHLTAGVSGMAAQMARQMASMQAQTETGLKAIEMQMKDYGTRVVAEQVKSSTRLAQIEEDRYIKLRAIAHRHHDKQLDLEIAAENKRAATLQAMIEKRDQQEYTTRVAGLAAQRKAEEASAAQSWKNMLDLERKRTADQQAEEQRRLKLSEEAQAKSFQTFLELEHKRTAAMEAEARRRLRIEEDAAAKSWQNMLDLERKKASAVERQRALNTSFLTSSLGSQISTAEKAAVYGSLGGDASKKFGSMAASADIAALRQQYAALPEAIKKSQAAIEGHNHAMNEAHAFARGLSGSLGGLWLTYGSMVPLAAGAAITSSLKNMVEIGKDVEYQLKFVAALSQEAVPMDRFLSISAGTVVGIQEAAQGMRILAQNGLDVTKSLAALPAVLNLSVIGELGVEQAALAATGALAAFNLEVTDLNKVGDILAQTAASSNTSVRALTESLKQGSVASSLYDVSLEETAAALGTLAKINITGAAAGTAYNNMLTSLYAPTQQGSKALKQLGIEATNADGSLKNSTTLLKELRSALSGYNEQARAAFIGDITTNRGAKAVATLLRYLDDYQEKIGDAKNLTGFMSNAVMELEDSVEGAFRRLKNSMSGSLVQAFTVSSPALQNLVDKLAHVAGSQGAVTLLTNMATAALRLTTMVVDNAKAIGLMVGAYAGFKLLTSVWASMTAAAATYEAAVVAAAGANVAFATTLRAALGVLGPLTLAVGAVTLAWSLYGQQTSKLATETQRLQNGLQTSIHFLEKETKAINDRNAALDKEAGVKGQKTITDQDKLVGLLEQRIALAEKEFEIGQRGGASDSLQMQRSNNLVQLYKEMKEAKRDLVALSEKEGELSKAQAAEKDKSARVALIRQYEDLQNNIKVLREERQRKGEADPTGSQAFVKSLTDLEGEILVVRGGMTDLTAAQAQLNLTREAYNKLLSGRPKDASNVELAAVKEQLEAEKNLAEIRRKSEGFQLEADRQAGRVGELQYLEQKLVLEKDGYDQAALTALAEAKTVADIEKKAGAYEKYRRLAQEAVEKSKQADIQHQTALSKYLDDLQKQNLATEAENYTKRGNLVEAFLTKFEADHGRTIQGLRAGLQHLSLEDAEAALFVDPTNTKALVAYNLALEQTVRLRNLMTLKGAGTDAAIFGTSKASFDAALADAQEKVATMKATAAEDGGLLGTLQLEATAKALQTEVLPGLNTMVTQLKEIASTSDDADLAAKASAAGTAVQKLTAELNKGANATGDMWKDVWKSIKSSAHDAWMSIGKDGESVFKKIGNVLRTSVMEVLYQMTIKKWVIDIGTSISGSFGGAGGGTSLLGNLMSAGSWLKAGSNLYSMFTGGIGGSLGTIGSGISTVGGWLGSSSVSGFGSGLASLAPGSGDAAMMAYANATGNVSGAASAGASTGAIASAAATIAAGLLAGKAISGQYSAIGGSSWNAVGAGAAIGSVIPGIGTAIGAAVGAVLGGVFNRAFGMGDKNVTSQGIRGTLSDTGVSNGVIFADWMQKGGWFRSDKHGTDTVALEEVYATSLTSGLTNLKAITENFGKVLGVDAGGLAGYSKTFEIQFDPKDATKAQEAITNFFKTVGDELATRLIPSISEFARVGETASTTLERISTNFKATDTVAQLLGKTGAEAFGASGLASVKAREQFVDLTGGLDALNSAMSSYAQNYLTEAERLAPVAKALDEAFAGLNVKAPTTRDEFKALVQGLNLADAENVKLFTSLMQLQDAFAQVNKAAETVVKTTEQIAEERQSLQDQLSEFLPAVDRRAKERAALDESNRLLYDQIQAHKDMQAAYEAEAESIQNALDKAKSFAEGLRKFKESLKLGDLSPLTPQQRYVEAKSQYETTLAAARGGDVTAQGNLESVAQAFLDASKTSYASSPQYLADFGRVMKDTEEASKWAQDQVDIAQAQLNALNAQVDGLLQVKGAVLTVNEAILKLAEALGPEGGPMADKAFTALLTSLYKDLLGRIPDPEGLSYWLNILKTGAASTSQVTDFIANSPERMLPRMYQEILGRKPDAEGLSFWMDSTMSKGLSLEDVRKYMLTSPEYLSMHGTGSQVFDVTRYMQGGLAPAASQAATEAQLQILRELQAIRREQAEQAGASIGAQFASTDLAAEKTSAATQEALQQVAWAQVNSKEKVV